MLNINTLRILQKSAKFFFSPHFTPKCITVNQKPYFQTPRSYYVCIALVMCSSGRVVSPLAARRSPTDDIKRKRWVYELVIYICR